jgi:uncharacterized protein (DUF486 family)
VYDKGVGKSGLHSRRKAVLLVLPTSGDAQEASRFFNDKALVIRMDEDWLATWYVAALVSWGIALAEYLLQVPANRIGYQQAGFTVAQLKIMQEVITLSVFVPFAVFYLREPFKLDYLWAALCMVGAVYFMFRSS